MYIAGTVAFDDVASGPRYPRAAVSRPSREGSDPIARGAVGGIARAAGDCGEIAGGRGLRWRESTRIRVLWASIATCPLHVGKIHRDGRTLTFNPGAGAAFRA